MRSIIALDVPMIRASSNVEIPAAKDSVAKCVAQGVGPALFEACERERRIPVAGSPVVDVEVAACGCGE